MKIQDEHYCNFGTGKNVISKTQDSAYTPKKSCILELLGGN